MNAYTSIRALTMHPAKSLELDLGEHWTFSDHALERMSSRDITHEDIANALWDFTYFEYGHSVALNLWGKDRRGRKLRVTLIPEICHIETVALFHQWTVGDYLKMKLRDT